MMRVPATLVFVSMLGMTPMAASLAQPRDIPNFAGKVQTVTGPVAPDALGRTSMQEHVFINFNLPWRDAKLWELAGRTRPMTATEVALYRAPLSITNLGDVTEGAPNQDNWILDDEALAITEVGHFAQAGGGTLVDTTSIGLGRRPQALKKVAEASGVHIVMGSGWYGSAWTPESLASRSVDSLTDEIVRDVAVGVKDTGIRAGIIGEIATDAHPTEGVERRILRAAARASRLTGAPLTIDASDDYRQQGAILDLLAAEGADLSRVVLAHTAYWPQDLSYVEGLMQRGVTIEFDLLGRQQTINRHRPLDSVVAKGIAKLIDAGYEHHIVLSQDVRSKTSLRAYGGTGYDYIETMFVPYLKKLGVSDEAIHSMLVENPQRILTFVEPQAALAVH